MVETLPSNFSVTIPVEEEEEETEEDEEDGVVMVI